MQPYLRGLGGFTFPCKTGAKARRRALDAGHKNQELKNVLDLQATKVEQLKDAINISENKKNGKSRKMLSTNVGNHSQYGLDANACLT